MCACYTPSKDAPFRRFDDVPHVNVLCADGVRNAAWPRQAQTVVVHAGIEYCLLDTHAAAAHCRDVSLAGRDDAGLVDSQGVCTVRRDAAGDVEALRVCLQCLGSLRSGNVPRHSLVCVELRSISRR